MDIFDILGPVMVGPSSSHTAGAARIGKMARTLLGGEPMEARIHLHGSFAETGSGHGTDRALVAGLLGMNPDDMRIPFAFQEAEKAGLHFTVDKIDLRDAHPNTAVIEVRDAHGKQLELQAASIGGGRIVVNKLDGIDVSFTGDYNTLVVRNHDENGALAAVTTILSQLRINVANMSLCRHKRGGDALMVNDDVLEYIIKRVRAIPHVEIVRLGSRTPVVCPQRITPELCAMLKKYHPVWLNTHFNTPKEFTPEAAKACAMLADAGIPLGNQSVLLAGVNDCSHVMMELVHGLVKMRVRPYYIYACDPSLGLSHFRTPVSKGIEIMEALRGHTSGYCVPTFVVDAPGGGGKTPVMPNYLISETPRKVILRNFEGVITSYTQPEHYVQDCHCDVCMGKKKAEKTGVAWVAEGTKQRYLEPTKLLRNERHVKK